MPLKNDLIASLEQIVNFPTKSGDFKANNACFDYLEHYLTNLGLKVDLQFSNSFVSLVATTQPTKAPRVLLQAHVDVVPAKVYQLQKHNGKLTGRGVFDMKFAAACYLQLVKDIKDELGSYDFGLMLTSDEEVGGENGVGMLLDRGYGAEVCILPDGGDNWQIETGCNGVWIARLSASGKTAHGSRPWEGQNAINKLLEALAEIRALFGEMRDDKSTLTISQIEGGYAMNQIPDYAVASLDMRFVSDRDCEQKKQALEAIVSKHGVSFETVAKVNCGKTDMKNPAISEFVTVAERVRGKQLSKTKSLGASDAHFFAEHNIPTIIIRPNGGGAHSDEEWIDEAELLTFYEVIKEYIKKSAKIA